MPIRFDQPSPVVPAISEGFGALQQYEHDRQYALQAAALQQHAQRPTQFSQAPMEPGTGYGYADHGEARFQQALALQDAQLSMAEKLRLQRLNGAVSTIQEQMDQGLLTPQEGGDLLTQVKTGLDPLRQRQARAHVAQQQAQLEAFQHQQAQMTAIQNMNATERARHVLGQTTTLPNGHTIYTDPMGRTHVMKPEREQAERLPPGAMNESQWQAAHHRAIEAFRRTHPYTMPDGQRNPRFSELSPPDYERWLRDNAETGTLGDTYQGYLASHGVGRGGAGGGAGSAAPPTTEGTRSRQQAQAELERMLAGVAARRVRPAGAPQPLAVPQQMPEALRPFIRPSAEADAAGY